MPCARCAAGSVSHEAERPRAARERDPPGRTGKKYVTRQSPKSSRNTCSTTATNRPTTPLQPRIPDDVQDRGRQTVSEIAEQLSLSVKTVSVYRARVLVRGGYEQCRIANTRSRTNCE